MSYRDTLPEDEAHLAKRLEGFGDVVFGFSVSQLALQLNLPQRPDDLIGHPLRYVLYFATFFALALFWLRFHRILAGTFRPTRPDLVLVMTYLAFIGLVPYALYAQSHMSATLEGARLGLAAYLIDGAALASISTTILFRNYRRGYQTFSALELLKLWRTIVVSFAIACAMLASLVFDLALGVNAGGPACFSIAVASLAGRRLTRVPPSAAWLRVDLDESGRGLSGLRRT